MPKKLVEVDVGKIADEVYLWGRANFIKIPAIERYVLADKFVREWSHNPIWGFKSLKSWLDEQYEEIVMQVPEEVPE